MAHAPNELLHGTLETLILKTVAQGPRHGYAIARWLEEATDEALQIEDGSLYPALYRMEQRGWITSAWAVTEFNRRARYYQLTRAGRKQLDAETESWTRLTAAVQSVLQS